MLIGATVLFHIQRGTQMTEVDGVEGAAEDAEQWFHWYMII